jgi:Protein of unknown function (DUF3604)
MYSPYAGRAFPTRVYWGETCEAWTEGPYLFAKGNEITASSGQRVKLSRPLDFLVVADHSDGMGFLERPARQEMVRK